MKQRRVKQLFPLVFLVVSLGLVACNRPAATADPKPAESPTVSATSVRVVTAQVAALRTNRSVSGTLEASVDSSVAAQTSGQVTAVLHREGDRVTAGTTLVQLDDSGLRQQLTDAQLSLKTAQINLQTSQRKTPETLGQNQSSLESAQISLEKAKRTQASNQRLYDAGGLAQTDLENSKAALAQAQATLLQAQGSLAQTARASNESLALLQVQVQQAQNRLAQTQRSLSQTRVKAPFAGEIAELSVEVGEFVNVGGKVVRLVDSSSLRAKFRVPSQDANALKPGAGVTLRALGRTLIGRVTRSAQVTGSNRLVDLYARFTGGQNLQGLTAGGSLEVGYALTLADSVLVPTGALSTDSGQTFVYIVKDGKAVQRPVTVIAETQGRVGVRGVAAGTQVIYPVPGSLQSGEPVSVVKETVIKETGRK